MKNIYLCILVIFLSVQWNCTSGIILPMVPIINIDSPTENQIFQSTDSISIFGIVKDEELNSLTIKVIDVKTDQLLYSNYKLFLGEGQYKINDSFKVNNVIDTLFAKLTVITEDYERKLKTKAVNFKIIKK